jgi:hypothetical protein
MILHFHVDSLDLDILSFDILDFDKVTSVHTYVHTYIHTYVVPVLSRENWTDYMQLQTVNWNQGLD